MIKARCDVNFFLLQWRINRMMQLHFEIDGIPCVVTIKIASSDPVMHPAHTRRYRIAIESKQRSKGRRLVYLNSF